MKCKKIIICVLLVIFFIVFCIASYIILKDLQELNESNESTENLIKESIEVNEETKKRSIDWDYLKLVNQDIVAWIEIEGTNINYPVLIDKNIYYLKHSFDKKYNSYGSIFTTNLDPFKEDETYLYGHNMRNGSMFSNLDKYMNEEFAYSHSKFKLYTPEYDYEASIFSVYSIDYENENNNIISLDFSERIEYYKKTSKYYISLEDNIDKIVKLCTCSYINSKKRPTEQRYYIVASLKEF